MRFLLVEAFEGDHHDVKTEENGEPDIILLDMKMPVMNGLKALRQILALDSRVAVIMMTAYGDIHAMEKAKDLGVLYYMGKPFDLFELRERVREIFLRIAT